MAAEPEQQAREKIDQLLTTAGWAVQDYTKYNPAAALGIALCGARFKPSECG